MGKGRLQKKNKSTFAWQCITLGRGNNREKGREARRGGGALRRTNSTVGARPIGKSGPLGKAA